MSGPDLAGLAARESAPPDVCLGCMDRGPCPADAVQVQSCEATLRRATGAAPAVPRPWGLPVAPGAFADRTPCAWCGRIASIGDEDAAVVIAQRDVGFCDRCIDSAARGLDDQRARLGGAAPAEPAAGLSQRARDRAAYLSRHGTTQDGALLTALADTLDALPSQSAGENDARLSLRGQAVLDLGARLVRADAIEKAAWALRRKWLGGHETLEQALCDALDALPTAGGEG